MIIYLHEDSLHYKTVSWLITLGEKNAETCFIYKGLIWFVHGQNIWDEIEEGNLKEAMYW